MKVAGYERAVCFSCGNAARELAEAGVDVLHIGKHGILVPQKWFTHAEIVNCFGQCFDATSGHLPIELMRAIGEAYKGYLGTLKGRVYVPTGSGETLVCLKMAYPDVEFVAVYNLDEATEYDEECVLNPLVELLACKVIK
jgi:hypothetical protein